MTSSAPIRGKSLILEFGVTDYKCDAISVVLDNEEADSDSITFCDAAAGGTQQYFFEITALQSTAGSSFWRYLWDTPAGTEVAFSFAPHGNVTPTSNEPHFIGTVKVPAQKPSIGGEASLSDTTRYTFETRMDVVGVPVLDDGSSS